ncbi:MAG: hypothetical protein IJK01_01965 [Clostridia bacterium]|nr:hypothetical protein [Clostridia bacterium]
MMYAVLYRSLLALLTAFFMAAGLGIGSVPVLRSVCFGSENGKNSGNAQKGIPSMGGVVILAAVLLASLLWGRDSYALLLVALLMTGLFGLLGFADDFIGTLRKTHMGLLPWQRLAAQIVLSIGFAVLLYRTDGFSGMLWLDRLSIGWLYLPFAALVIFATVNAVHLTDGIDGLVPHVSGIYALFISALLCMAVLCAPVSTSPDRLLNLSALSVFAAAAAGGCIGYLVQGAYPARVRLGRTGTYTLGGAIAAMALLSGTALLLPLMGVCFVISAVTLIVQFAATRLGATPPFKDAPLHMHLKRMRANESRIVSMYGILTCICSAAALLVYWFLK